MSGCQIRWPAAKRRGAATIAVVALAAGAVSCAGQAASPPHRSHSPLVVSLTDGDIRGKMIGGTDEYLGIPYAAPPVGPLRWRPPQPPAHWHGIRTATQFAPHCAQPAGVFGRASTSENCLYLNVFAPAGHRLSPLPVMVWIHGGGFVGGESDDYDPSGLVADGVIVVTINYRLGALGFLAHPALADRPGGPTGDYGLMDQQAALRWVQHNIRAFGGNRPTSPSSASPRAARACCCSSSRQAHAACSPRRSPKAAATPSTRSHLASAEAAGRAFAAKAGCASQTAQCLRSLPVATILADQDQSGASADIDGLVLTQPLKAALTSGDFSHVPVIDGSNHDEWRLFVALATFEGHPVTAANYQPMIAATLHVSRKIAALIAIQYPLSDYKSPALALSTVGTDAIFACPTLDAGSGYVLLRSDLRVRVQRRERAEPLPEPWLPVRRCACLRTSVPVRAACRFARQPVGPQQTLAAAMRQEWTSFATTGVPSAAGASAWPRFTAATQAMLSLVPPKPAPETDFSAEHHCAFWALGGD